MRHPQQSDEVILELAGELLDLLVWVRGDGHDISYMRFGLDVAFEAVFVPALLFADLTIPSEPLTSFAAHHIRDIFARSDLRSWHVVNRWSFVFRRRLEASCARPMKRVSSSVEGRMVKAQE